MGAVRHGASWFLFSCSNMFYFQVEGILCGFDPFMNLVLDDATEFNKDGTAKGKIGKNKTKMIK